MNFFGHAVVSRRAGPSPAEPTAHVGSPGYALGSMLPDFASMCGGRLEHAEDPAIAAGIALHHRTDAVFHHLAPVVALMHELHVRLQDAGCSRGPTLAVAHVGVELLLDGVLVEDGECRRLYVEAVAHSGASVVWREAQHRERFAVLQQRLQHHGAPDDLGRPEGVTERLLRVLQRRPRLAPVGRDAVVIGAAIAALAPRVQATAATILRGVHAGLGGA